MPTQVIPALGTRSSGLTSATESEGSLEYMSPCIKQKDVGLIPTETRSQGGWYVTWAGGDSWESHSLPGSAMINPWLESSVRSELPGYSATHSGVQDHFRVRSRQHPPSPARPEHRLSPSMRETEAQGLP